MKRIQGNIIRDVMICVVCVFAFAAYCSSQKWLLMFRGHQEMFLFDWGYIKDILLHRPPKLVLTAEITEVAELVEARSLSLSKHGWGAC